MFGKKTIPVLSMCLIAVAACRGTSETPAELRGAYLGQTPPGMTREIFARGVVSTHANELNAVFTPDGNELFFTRKTNGRNTLMTVRQEAGLWTAPSVAEFSGTHDDVDPFVTRDGSRLYFSSKRPVTRGGDSKDADLWYLKRQDGGGWGAPVHLGELATAGKDDYYTSLSNDGTLYFSIFETGGGGDIYRAPPHDGGFGPAKRVEHGISTEASEHDPFIAPDGSYLIFTSDRPGGIGSADLYISFAASDGSFTEPVNMGPSVNSPAYDFCAMLSQDSRFLFLTANNDIYWVDAKVIDTLRPAEVRDTP